MQHVAFAASLILLVPGAAAAGSQIRTERCAIRSDYGLQLGRDGITLRREQGAPADVRLQDRRLWIDGNEVTLSAADRKTVAAMQAEVDALMPEVRDIAVEAVGMAVAALAQVAESLGGADGGALAGRMQAVQQRFIDDLDRDLAAGRWDGAAMEDGIEAVVAELTPQLAGGIAAQAVKAALSGDEAAAREIERRAAAMARTLEAEMTRRGSALESRVDALCPRLEHLAELEDTLELRLADGSRLDLVQR